jgi:hypothetical protein
MADELLKTRFIKGSSKLVTSTLRDLIIRYARWQEAGGVRQSLMISNRRGSSVSNEENEQDLDGDVIAWDFDTSYSDAMSQFTNDERSPTLNSLSDRGVEISQYSEPVPARQLTGPSQGFATPALPAPPPTPVTGPHSSAAEHPLEQLFNDGTVRSSTAPAALRPRKDTLTSRPVSPLATINASATQPTSQDMDFRTHQTVGSASFDLRLPDVTPIVPIQIEIPSPEETFRKDPPATRSRSATVTRSTRSDSGGSSGLSRTPRHNPAEPMPQPQSPPRTNRNVSPKPQPPMPPPMPPPNTLPSKSTVSNSPQPPPSLPFIPPSSPATSHVSKSVPVNPPASTLPSATAFNDQALTKARSTELKTSRPPNLTLTVRP